MSAPVPAVLPAYRIDGGLVGPDAFYAVACDPRRHVVVEACAGAGKTWMLVSRIVRSLLDGAQPQEILAITFTRKAAGEMRARLAQWLSQWAADTDTDTATATATATDADRVAALQQRGLDIAQAKALAPALAGLQQRLQQSGRTVEIRTFHAWFSQLLRAAPLELLNELGVQRDAQIIDDLADHESEVFRRFRGALIADDTLRADYTRLVERRGRSQVHKWLLAAWAKRIEIELADAANTLESSVAAPVSPWRSLDADADADAADADAADAHPALWVRLPQVRLVMQRCAVVLGRVGKAKPAKAASEIENACAIDLASSDANPSDQEPGDRRPSDEQPTGRSLTAKCTAVFDAWWDALHTQAGTPRKQLGDAPEQQAAIDLLQSLRRALDQHDARAEHLQMVRLSRALFVALAAYKRARGLIEMADLERSAVALLGDSTLSGWVQERLDARVRHLLIDEFQDTSPLQWHALADWLAGYVGAGGGASGQRPPSVFIVGDPKQSIYRFRRAEPKVFVAARDFVQRALGGQLLECDHTRRNAPEVLAALNAVFSQAADEGQFTGFRAHSTSQPASTGAPTAATDDTASRAGVSCLALVPRETRRAGAAADVADTVWRDTLQVPRVEAEQRLRQQEADAVAIAVRDGIRGGVVPGDIQVLCRKRESLRLVAHSLAALGVPCAAVEEAQLFDAPEVRDLVAVLDVVASPSHALSLAQALKSPVFGCTDDDLVQLARAVAAAAASAGAATDVDAGDAAEPRPSDALGWWKALQSVASPSAALQRARRLLTDWQQAAGVLPPHDLLDRIVHEGQVVERVLAAVPPARRAAAQASINALLAQSLALDGARNATPYNFVRALKRRRLKVAAAAQPDAVQLLTIHGAKGLEAELVFVMDSHPEAAVAETATLLVRWPVDSHHPLCCAFVYAESQCPPSLADLFSDELAARRREELNGLYVAMTRAKQRLVFSATAPHTASPTVTWWQRLAPVGTAWSPRWPLEDVACETPHGVTTPVGALPFAVQVLPRWWPAAGVPPSAHDSHGSPIEPHSAIDRPAPINNDAARLGQAVHRVLEWAVRQAEMAARSATTDTEPFNASAKSTVENVTAENSSVENSAAENSTAATSSLHALCSAAAVEFGVAVLAVHRVAHTILTSPACTRFFDARQWLWSGSEVDVVDAGEGLRIDRLVHLQPAPGDVPNAAGEGGDWWVIDYKLSHSPAQLAAYRAQLLRYRCAVLRLQPGARVRCAFITGAGTVVELQGD